MRNRYLDQLDRLVKIRIVGSNVNSYLRRVIKKKIEIVKLIPVSYKEVHVILKFSNYKKLLELKSIYEVSVIEYVGGMKIEDNIKKNYLLLLFMVIGLVFIIFLSKMVFSIEIIHSNNEIRELVKDELYKYDIVKYRLKKRYEELEKIETKILENNKDRLEWIEISSYGTKYIVRIEERKLNENVGDFKYQSIVSKKDAVITRIDAISGEKVKQVNEYVNKGDTIISGYIIRPDNSKVATRALGSVYGEVWYEVDVDYPIVYYESNLTGKSKTGYALYFFGYRFGLFDFDEYRSFESKTRVLFNFNMLDIRFVKEKLYEVEVIEDVYTFDVARSRAVDYIKEKLINDNRDIVKIKDVKIISEVNDGDSISFKLFVRAIENIGEVVAIDEVIDNS